ncbi:hypothetical protein QR680_013965 [Steinernema hermaphroditum]|uniref:Uncharacterized protein n=1 Tax=Steinernema hermaphroditum TaxID=289476 RepID=A0AA39I7A0_9BILA|nr:hypothetical protein QR680_013965 [Steinernema hermaphroditum]
MSAYKTDEMQHGAFTYFQYEVVPYCSVSCRSSDSYCIAQLIYDVLHDHITLDDHINHYDDITLLNHLIFHHHITLLDHILLDDHITLLDHILLDDHITPLDDDILFDDHITLLDHITDSFANNYSRFIV